MDKYKFQEKIGKVMVILAWITLLVLLTFYFSKHLAHKKNPNQELTLLRENGNKTVVLERNHYGHYVANGKINNHPVTFLLDTGATHTSIPEKISQKIGLKRGRPTRALTANGSITVYSTRLASINLGGIQLQNIKASINPNMNGNEVLLGMSFLKKFKLLQEGNQLSISTTK